MIDRCAFVPEYNVEQKRVWYRMYAYGEYFITPNAGSLQETTSR